MKEGREEKSRMNGSLLVEHVIESMAVWRDV